MVQWGLIASVQENVWIFEMKIYMNSCFDCIVKIFYTSIYFCKYTFKTDQGMWKIVIFPGTLHCQLFLKFLWTLVLFCVFINLPLLWFFFTFRVFPWQPVFRPWMTWWRCRVIWSAKAPTDTCMTSPARCAWWTRSETYTTFSKSCIAKSYEWFLLYFFFKKRKKLVK